MHSAMAVGFMDRYQSQDYARFRVGGRTRLYVAF